VAELDPKPPALTEWNGIKQNPDAAPLPNAPRSLTAHLSQHSTKHFKCNIAKHMEKLYSATSEYKYCTIAKYVVQHRKIFTATSKIYVLHQQKICTQY
jgi:hypothetical protein